MWETLYDILNALSLTEIRELLDFVVNVLHRRCGMFRSVFLSTEKFENVKKRYSAFGNMF